MSGYRDSYFQYHHLVDSHQVLYNEWNQDEFPPPDEQEVGNHASNNGTSGGKDGGAGNTNDFGDNAQSKGYSTSNNGINVYWDYFHDEEDWNLFRNVHLESNGVATFNQPSDGIGRGDATGLADAGQNCSPSSGAVASSITGSIFNNRVTRMALVQNSKWNDLNVPHP